MGLRETIDETDTAVVVAAAIGIAVVGLVVLVALTVVLAAVVGTFVLGVGEEVEEGVQAGAAVTGGADENELTVTWTSNQNAEALLVEWITDGGAVEVTGTSDGVQADTGRVELAEVGQSVTLSDGDPDAETTVSLRVTAVAGDEQSVVLSKETAV